MFNERKAETYDISQIISNLPDGIRWQNHIEYQLLPYWLTPKALGEPIGNFPTTEQMTGLCLMKTFLPKFVLH